MHVADPQSFTPIRGATAGGYGWVLGSQQYDYMKPMKNGGRHDDSFNCNKPPVALA